MLKPLENHMVIGDYYPEPPKPEIDRSLQYAIEREESSPRFRYSSVRLCLDCKTTARIVDGVHANCPGKDGL